jgi:hypothetical protein
VNSAPLQVFTDPTTAINPFGPASTAADPIRIIRVTDARASYTADRCLALRPGLEVTRRGPAAIPVERAPSIRIGGLRAGRRRIGQNAGSEDRREKKVTHGFLPSKYRFDYQFNEGKRGAFRDQWVEAGLQALDVQPTIN